MLISPVVPFNLFYLCKRGITFEVDRTDYVREVIGLE
jgi:hypothetical protein